MGSEEDDEQLAGLLRDDGGDTADVRDGLEDGAGNAWVIELYW